MEPFVLTKTTYRPWLIEEVAQKSEWGILIRLKNLPGFEKQPSLSGITQISTGNAL